MSKHISILIKIFQIRINKVVNSLQNEFYGANRTTNRDVLVMEKKLSEIKKALDEEVNEYEYARK